MKRRLRKREQKPDNTRRTFQVELLEDRRLLALQPMSLGDLETGEAGSFPRSFVEYKGEVYFTAGETQIWKTDGTEDGTVKILDAVGSDPVGPTYLSEIVVYDDMLVFARLDQGEDSSFFAQDDDNIQLWKSDGTAQGTELVKDFGFGSFGGSDGAYFTSINGMLLGTVGTPDHGMEIWSTDLTTEGTQIVKDIYPGAIGSFPYSLEAVGDRVFFTARDEDHGSELWETDGTELGTKLVKDIQPGSVGSYPRGLKALDEMLLFTASDGAAGFELWKSDGTMDGTALLKDIEPSSNEGIPNSSYPGYFVELEDELFFTASRVGDDAQTFTDDDQAEWWKTNGTTAGTVLVKNFGEGSQRDYSSGSANGYVFASFDDGQSGSELWKTDGTSDGTMLVKDINPGTDENTNDPAGSHPFRLIDVDGRLYFQATDEINGNELWVTDGREEGTQLVKDFNTGSTEYGPESSFHYPVVSVGGKLFFGADDPEKGSEPWVITPPVSDYQNPDNPLDTSKDGSVAPVDALRIINPLNTGGSGPLKAFVGEPPTFFDVNGDRFLAAIDALLVINYLNGPEGSSEPEGEAAVDQLVFAFDLSFTEAFEESIEQLVQGQEIDTIQSFAAENQYHTAKRSRTIRRETEPEEEVQSEDELEFGEIERKRE